MGLGQKCQKRLLLIGVVEASFELHLQGLLTVVFFEAVVRGVEHHTLVIWRLPEHEGAGQRLGSLVSDIQQQAFGTHGWRLLAAQGSRRQPGMGEPAKILFAQAVCLAQFGPESR
ncbi:hypothetical protein [Pseudomonas glycinae]|uniref:hypothetical protein n=1 Tax=Pseudomonas glycinae TaxID=1785145 RepID=UPI001F2EE550|nr:hypothetical protein [Pseudomonas glycinae]